MTKKKKSGPLYNYRSPRDYEVFNWGNEADPPFKLKSGNTPSFKHVGSSPFEKQKGEISRGWQVAVAGLTSGLDAVYGSGKINFSDGKVKFSKDEEKKKCYAEDGKTQIECPKSA